MKVLNHISLKPILLCVFLLGVVGVFTPIKLIKSQTPIEYIYKGRSVSSIFPLTWSTDSKRLAFQTDHRKHAQDGWMIYDVETGQTTSAPFNPSLPPISPAQGDVLGLSSYQTEYFQASPNGRYLVYAAPKSAGTWQDGRSLIALTDLQTNETKIINLPLTYWYAKWSADSSAFLIKTGLRSAGTVSFYFRNFFPSVTSVESIVLDEIIGADNQRIEVYNVYDISSNGQMILLGYAEGIAIWNTQTPLSLLSFTGSLLNMGASFSIDDQEVYFVTQTGMFRYNLSTRQTTPLPLKMGVELLERAINVSISPDGKWVAIVYQPLDFSDPELYILETVLSLP